MHTYLHLIRQRGPLVLSYRSRIKLKTFIFFFFFNPMLIKKFVVQLKIECFNGEIIFNYVQVCDMHTGIICYIVR